MNRRVVYQGRKFNVTLQTVATKSGARDVEIIEHPGAVVILPFLDEVRLCLVRNWRHALGRRFLELPAGTRDPGETPLQTAQRELREETGYTAIHWEELLTFYPSPGILNESMVLFRASALTAGPTHLEPTEDLETEAMSFTGALELAISGKIQDAKTLIGLYHWKLRDQHS